MVDIIMKTLKRKSEKLHALKDKIMMHVIGMVWVDLATPCSKNGEECTVLQLDSHLKTIIGIKR